MFSPNQLLRFIRKSASPRISKLFKQFLSISLFIFLLSSCSKDNNSPNQNTTLPKTYTEDVRSSIFGNSLVTFNLSYDGNNRLVSMVSNAGGAGMKMSYQYSGSSYTLDLYNANVLNLHDIFWLNASSFVDSTFQFNNTNDTSTEKYFYNSNKQMIEKKEYQYHYTGSVPYRTTNYTFDSNGNLLTESDDFGRTTTYTYYSDLPNANFFQIYFPQSKNLVKTASVSDNGFNETETHYYSFDTNNRLVKDSSSLPVTNVIIIKTYTY